MKKRAVVDRLKEKYIRLARFHTNSGREELSVRLAVADFPSALGLTLEELGEILLEIEREYNESITIGVMNDGSTRRRRNYYPVQVNSDAFPAELLSDVYEALFRRKKDTGYVFLDAKKRPFEAHGLERELREVRYKAGLRPYGWHTLRHTFASHLAMRGVPLHVVQKPLGHSSIATTMRYAHVAPSELRTAIDMLNPTQAFNAELGQPVGNQWQIAQQTDSKKS